MYFSFSLSVAVLKSSCMMNLMTRWYQVKMRSQSNDAFNYAIFSRLNVAWLAWLHLCTLKHHHKNVLCAFVSYLCCRCLFALGYSVAICTWIVLLWLVRFVVFDLSHCCCYRCTFSCLFEARKYRRVIMPDKRSREEVQASLKALAEFLRGSDSSEPNKKGKQPKYDLKPKGQEGPDVVMASSLKHSCPLQKGSYKPTYIPISTTMRSSAPGLYELLIK